MNSVIAALEAQARERVGGQDRHDDHEGRTGPARR